jgi:hypothetical protein
MKKILPIGLIVVMTCLFSDGLSLNVEANTKEFPSFYVNHKTKDRSVLVECIVSGISFRKGEGPGQRTGKIIIWIDEQRKQEADQAVFIIKGLSPGSHKIALDVVNLHNKPYGLRKEFMVNIPK